MTSTTVPIRLARRYHVGWTVLLFLSIVVGALLAIAAWSGLAVVLLTASLADAHVITVPVALAIVFWYSLAKRYTTWTQLFLGLAMAVAPVGGWFAVGGRGGAEPWLLAAAAFLLGMGVGAGQPMSMSLIYAMAPAGRASEAAGLRVVVNNVAHLAIPLLFGGVGVALGFAPVFLSNAAMLAVGGELMRRRGS